MSNLQLIKNKQHNKKLNQLIHLASAMENYPLITKVEHFRETRHLLLKNSINFNKPTNENLKIAYHNLVNSLKKSQPEWFTRSSKQIYVENKLKKHTKVIFSPNYLFGFRTVDLFFPYLTSTSNKMKGLIIEVDGGIHNKECKMRRDDKANTISSEGMNIAFTSIANEDVWHTAVLNIIKGIKSFKRLGFRSKENLVRRMNLITLIIHNRSKSIKELYQLSNKDLKKALRLLD